MDFLLKLGIFQCHVSFQGCMLQCGSWSWIYCVWGFEACHPMMFTVKLCVISMLPARKKIRCIRCWVPHWPVRHTLDSIRLPSSTVTAPARPIETIPATFFCIYMVRSSALARQTWKLMSSWTKFCFSLWAAFFMFLLCFVLPQWASWRFWNWTIEDWGVYIYIYIYIYYIYILFIYIYYILYIYVYIYIIYIYIYTYILLIYYTYVFLYRFSTILVGVLFKLTLTFPYFAYGKKSMEAPKMAPPKGHSATEPKISNLVSAPRTKKKSNCRCTLPETNVAPENGLLQDYFPFGKAYFQGLC